MYLGFSHDQEAFDYFRRHFGHFFPALVQVDRTNWLWQATNLLAVKERLWCRIRDSLVFYDSTVAIVDSMPIQVCQFARASRCQRYFCKHYTCRQTFYGFRLHLRLCWSGVITQMSLKLVNVAESKVV